MTDAIERALRVIGRPQHPEHVISARALCIPAADSWVELWDRYRDTNLTAEVWVIASLAFIMKTLDPDGEVYPWLDGYPLVGQIVMYDSQTWTVLHRNASGTVDLSSDDTLEAEVIRSELRPATWTAEQELELQNPPMGGVVTEL